MDWKDILNLVLKYGPEAIDLAEFIYNKIATGTPPTAEDWAKLRSLSSFRARDKMIDSLNRAGIPLDSPQAIALLALV